MYFIEGDEQTALLMAVLFSASVPLSNLHYQDFFSDYENLINLADNWLLVTHTFSH